MLLVLEAHIFTSPKLVLFANSWRVGSINFHMLKKKKLRTNNFITSRLTFIMRRILPWSPVGELCHLNPIEQNWYAVAEARVQALMRKARNTILTASFSLASVDLEHVFKSVHILQQHLLKSALTCCKFFLAGGLMLPHRIPSLVLHVWIC